jgi:hypothetical protein
MFFDTDELVSTDLWRRRYDLATEKLKHNISTRPLSMLMTYAAQVPVSSDFSSASTFAV